MAEQKQMGKCFEWIEWIENGEMFRIRMFEELLYYIQ